MMLHCSMTQIYFVDGQLQPYLLRCNNSRCEVLEGGPIERLGRDSREPSTDSGAIDGSPRHLPERLRSDNRSETLHWGCHAASRRPATPAKRGPVLHMGKRKWRNTGGMNEPIPCLRRTEPSAALIEFMDALSDFGPCSRHIGQLPLSVAWNRRRIAALEARPRLC